MFRAKHPRRGVLALLASPLLALIPRKAGADMPEPYSAYADQYSGNGSPSSAPPSDDTGGITPGTLIERLERIERWMAMHGGNIGAANAQYPHPNQLVSVLGYGIDSLARSYLTPEGIQVVTPIASAAAGIIFTPELRDSLATSDPAAYLEGYAVGATAVANMKAVGAASSTEAVHSAEAGTLASTSYLTALHSSLTARVTAVANSVTGTARVTVAGMLSIGAAQAKTIASGVITITTSSYLAVDTEAAAGTDDLDTINGSAEGDILVIRAANSARTVVIKNGTGNISCGGDITLDHTDDKITLFYNGAKWVRLADANNNA